MTPDPLYLTLAATLTLIVAYLVADRLARGTQRLLRTISPDEHDAQFADRPARLIRFGLFAIIAAALGIAALRLTGYTPESDADREALVQWLFQRGLRIAIIVLAGYLVIRIGSAAARRFEREMSRGSGPYAVERTKRAQTLSRMLQKALVTVVIAVGGLMALREIDIDIRPALAGAGIVGLAVGFGAQTLVRDIISGFFLIIEDQVRVGDVAVVNSQSGLVEAVNLRTIVLRDEEGTVHVFPNGEVKTLANKSKDFGYYVFTVGVSYDDDPDQVTQAILDAGDTVCDDPEFKPHILERTEVFGVDAFEPGQIVIKGRIKTVPLKQWVVGRELRKQIARVFRERDIRIPVPQMTLRLSPAEARALTEKGPAGELKSE
jgi:small conductance mechanosensitive channel